MSFGACRSPIRTRGSSSRAAWSPFVSVVKAARHVLVVALRAVNVDQGELILVHGRRGRLSARADGRTGRADTRSA
jgi:hypothetical protein